MKHFRWLISLDQPKAIRSETNSGATGSAVCFPTIHSAYRPFRALFQALWHISCIYFPTDEDRISFH
jgi:hypothetical protein